MKFMKLGTKPDAFQEFDGNSIRHVSSDLETDVVINIDEVRFYLHKFPLVSKSNLLQRLVSRAGEDKSQEVAIADFPGGPESFEICAKFCYGIAVTVSAYNVVAARCAADYLEMTEDVDKGNLVFKIEVFLNSSVFRSWKDSIIVLQTCEALLPWAENLQLVGRCIDSIASKTLVEPAKVKWSYTRNRRLLSGDKILDSGKRLDNGTVPVPKDWWVEDVTELEIKLYKRLMMAINSRGRTDSNVIGGSLKTYALRWLPESFDELTSEDHMQQYKYVLESIICLLPSDQIVSCSCKFLLKLLKVAVVVGVDESVRENLVERISLKLDEASVKDLMIPARSPQSTSFDVELVHSIVKKFVRHETNRHDIETTDQNMNVGDFVTGHGSLSSVGRLVDGYLAEVAHEMNLSVSDFVNLARSIPGVARAVHDGLYMAIDIYLKEHPHLSKSDRRKICGVMDVKKLTLEASIHAAQNERLPLRLIVQVLFFEQIRAAAAGALSANNSQCATASAEEECEKTSMKNYKFIENKMSKIRVNNDEDQCQNPRLSKGSSRSSSSGPPVASRPIRMFSKLWIMGKAQHRANRSSETSGSSRSPTSIVVTQTKSCSSASSGRRRFSIS